MKSYRMYASSINDRYIDEIVETLRRGGVVVYPTDSTYAIGCDALSNRAVERVCRMRGINPAKQRLSMVCADISQAARYARIDNRDFAMLRQNTPGPFTFLFRAASTLPRAFKGRKIVGVRIPALEKDTVMKVFYIRDLGTYANWQATKSTGDFDARTFEVKMRPSRPIDGLRPGMSVLLKE